MVNLEMKKVATCKDCYLYKPVDATKGHCIDIEVSADMNAKDCKQKAYRPKYLGI